MHSRETYPEMPAPLLYTLCDWLTEWLIYFMVLFGPWAFGGTEPWAIQTMSVTGFTLGGLFLFKCFLRRATYYQPPRWDAFERSRGARVLSWLLGLLTLLILGYMAVGAANARAKVFPAELQIVYQDCIAWLPHSYDSESTWRALQKYLGLACFFWALRDWLLHLASGEGELVRLGASEEGEAEEPLYLPLRLRRLLWLVCINGGLLAIEGIAQRLSGSDRLLWLVQPWRNRECDLQFGPYAYRSNFVQYINLVWPVCLGFWYVLHRRAQGGSGARGAEDWADEEAAGPWAQGSGQYRPLPPLRPLPPPGSPAAVVSEPVREPGRIVRVPVEARRGGAGWKHHLLLLAAILMALCPLIATSRAGAMIGVALAVATLVVLFASSRSLSNAARTVVVSCFAVILAIGWVIDGGKLANRLKDVEYGFADREHIWANASRMAEDYPVFGTGAGTFGRLYQFYRTSVEDTWMNEAHNDWLETRVTFGLVGSGMIGLAFLVVVLRWFAAGGMGLPHVLTWLIWVAMAGCLLHARVDFPFQIHSILSLFLVHCAILSCATRRA